MTRRVRLERDTLWLSGADIAALLVGIAVHVVLTRTYTDGDYGRWVLLLDLYYVTSTLIDLGLPTLIGRDSERIGKMAHNLVHRTLRIQIRLTLPIILIGGFVGWYWVSGSIVWLTAALILALSASVQILAYAHRSALRALGESRQEALVRLVDRGATAIGIVLAAWLFGAHPIALSLATFAGPLGAILLAINLGEKKLTSITNKGESLGYVNDDVRTLLMLGLPFLLASIALVLNVRVEKLMLGVLATPEDIEVFQIAWLAFIAGYAPILSVRAVMLSWFGETRHDVDILQHRQQRALKIIFIATVPGLIIGYTLGQASIGWVFPNYANDAKPIFLLLLIAWALALNASVPITMIQVSEKPMYYAAVLWFGIIVDTIFCILMIPEQGTEGAAIGAIVGAASVLISAMILNRKLYLNTTAI